LESFVARVKKLFVKNAVLLGPEPNINMNNRTHRLSLA
jgi:hypothetical protein